MPVRNLPAIHHYNLNSKHCRNDGTSCGHHNRHCDYRHYYYHYQYCDYHNRKYEIC